MILFSGWRTLLAFPAMALGVWLIPHSGGVILGGAFVTVLGFVFNLTSSIQQNADGTTRRKRYSIFWIPLQFWGLAIVALGVFGVSRGI